MKLRMKGAVAAAASIALIATGAGVANAYTGTGPLPGTTTPPWEAGNVNFPSAPGFPAVDPNSKGGVLFYDASGNQIAGGPLSSIGTYLATNGTAARPGTTTANASFAVPNHLTPNTVNWVTAGATGSSFWPLSPAVGGITTSATVPVATLNTAGGEGSITAILGVITNDATAGYDHVLQVRVKDAVASNTAGNNSNNFYWSTDIEYNNTATAFADGLAAGQWKVIYPAVNVPATTTATPTASPVSPVTFGTSVTFSTTVSLTAGGALPAAAGGTVTFFDGATQIGAAKSYTGGTITSDATTTLSVASHTVTASYSPAGLFGPSTSSALSFSVTGVSVGTTTQLTLGATTVNQPNPVTGTAVVTPAAGGAAITVGSVAFHLDSAAGTVLGTDANGADGFTFSSASSTISPLGAHTVYAVYLGGSSGATNYTTSTSAPASFTLAAATGANPDVQNIETSIDQGTILISTPYNATAPLVVPQLTLTTSGQPIYTGSAAFGNIAIHDQRPANLPYDVYATSSNLLRSTGTSGLPAGANSTIDSHNVGLTGIGYDSAFTSTAVATGQVFTDAPAAAGIQPGAYTSGNSGLGIVAPATTGAHIMHAATGYGDTIIKGTLTINAPTNTWTGLYDGTVTFTAL